jgi:hypothetical protein
MLVKMQLSRPEKTKPEQAARVDSAIRSPKNRNNNPARCIFQLFPASVKNHVCKSCSSSPVVSVIMCRDDNGLIPVKINFNTH